MAAGECGPRRQFETADCGRATAPAPGQDGCRGEFGPAAACESTALRCAANMPRPHPPLGTRKAFAILSPNGLSPESARSAAGLDVQDVLRGATCVDEPLNNHPYGQTYPEIVPQLFVAVRRLSDCMSNAPAPASHQAMGRDSKVARRAHPAARLEDLRTNPRGLGRVGDPGEGSLVLAAAPLGRTVLRERRAHARRLVPT